jgi:hypothetical protein
MSEYQKKIRTDEDMKMKTYDLTAFAVAKGSKEPSTSAEVSTAITSAGFDVPESSTSSLFLLSRPSGELARVGETE